MKSSIYILILLFLSATVSALTADPDELYFEDILSNHTAEKIITVHSDEVEPVQVRFSATEPIGSWIRFEPESSYISKSSPAKFRILVKPSASAGSYQGYIIMNTFSRGNKLTTSISTSSDIKTTVKITEDQIIQANVKDVVVEAVEEGNPIPVLVTVQNQGNIELNSFFIIELLDAPSIHSEESLILPLSTATLKAEIPSLPIGKHYADITVFAGDMLLRKHNLPFSVVERGSLSKKEAETIQVHPAPIPLSTGLVMILIWIFILLSVLFIRFQMAGRRKNDDFRKR